MPTGYTAKTLPEFVMECARAFGALILMRDDPPGTPIPDEFEPSDYHAKQVADAEWRIRNLDGKGDESAAFEADQDYQRAHAAWVETKERRKARRERYEAMLAQVHTWEPPTPDHDGLKKFMIEQLEESIRFDCGGTDGVDSYYPEPFPESAADWKARLRAKAERDVKYHSEEHAKEVERARERSAWVRALRESLAEPVGLGGRECDDKQGGGTTTEGKR